MARSGSSRTLGGALRRGRGLVVGAVLAALLVTSLYAALRPRVFTAEATLAIAPQGRVTGDVFVKRVNGIGQEMCTPATLGRVVDAARFVSSLDGISEAARIDRRTRIVHELVDQTEVVVHAARDAARIEIATSGPDADRCFRTVNELVKIYQLDAKEKPRAAAQAAVEEVDLRRREAQGVRDREQGAVDAFEEENAELLGGTERQLEEIRSKIRTLENERIAVLEQEIKRLRADIALEPAFKDVERMGVDEQKKAALTAQIAALQGEIRELMELNQAAEDSPGVVSRRRSIAELQSQLAAVLADKRKIVEKITNPLHGEIQKDLATKQGQIGIARRELQLANQAELELLGKVERMPQLRRERDALVERRDGAQAALDAVAEEVASAKKVLAAVEAEGLLSFTTEQAAEPPSQPSGPHTLLLAFAGILVGAFAGSVTAVVRDRLDQSFTDVDMLAGYLGVPTLGVVNEIVTPRSVAEAAAQGKRQKTILTALAVVSVVALALALVGGVGTITGMLGGGV